MSDFDSNPFADPHASNPFADQSVRQASQSGQKVESLDDFNPFATDQFVAPSSRPAATQPAPQPAVLQTTYDAPPPAYSEPIGGSQASADYLNSRQEELERKAAELDRRERAMQQNVLTSTRANNFPPLPSIVPVKPCFYQDISIEIPLQFQRIVRINFYIWIAYSCLLFLNLWVSVAFFAVSASYSIANQSGVTFGLAVLYFLLWTPLSFVCWFRAIYNAFKSDSSFFFFVYFFIFFLQFVANVIQAVGIPGSGSVGWISGFQTISVTSEMGPKAMGIVMVIVGLLFSILAACSLMMLFRVHRLYRATGASFSKAQEEFAHGIVTNRTVQQTAAGVAGSAARGVVEQSYSGANRY